MQYVLTSSESIGSLLPGLEADVLPLSVDGYSNKISTFPKRNPQCINKMTDLAYVIYTSGSTGTPKGVMIEHENAINTIIDINQRFSVNSTDRSLMISNMAFDLSVYDIFGLIIVGGATVIPTNEERQDYSQILSLLRLYSVSIWDSVPQVFSLMYDAGLSINDIKKIKTVMLSGDWLSVELMRKLSQSGLDNLYSFGGATECSIWSVYYHIRKVKDNLNSIPYGKPLKNQSVYVLDSNLNPLPIGVPGDLYIGGDGLARGYLKRRKLTEQRFISNPFVTEKEKSMNYNLRIYRTGDIVKWLPDKNLEFLGRDDNQVKIRGFRIELGEIENKLSEHPLVSQSIVLCKERRPARKNIVAYYVLNRSTREKNGNLIKSFIKYLSDKLPDYMIPSFFVKLEKLPLSVNGKIDRKALPDPEFEGSKKNYKAPRNSTEKKIGDIWQELLGIDKVGINDNFFNLGGNSILVIKLVNKISRIFNKNITVKDIFNYPTISSFTLEKLLPKNDKHQSEFPFKNYQIIPDKKNNYKSFPLTIVQKAYLMGREEILQLGGVSTHGYTEYSFGDLDIEKIEQAWNKLIIRHPGLRTVFGGSEQVYLKRVPYYKIKVYECAGYDNSTEKKHINDLRCELSHQIFNLTKYPLFDIRITRFKSKIILHFSIDALILDGTSAMILLSELTKLYNNLSTVLPKLNLTARDYILELERINKSTLFEKDKKYWFSKINDMPYEITLPLLTRPDEIKKPKFSRLSKTFISKGWSKFREKAKAANISETSALLTMYGLVLSRWSSSSNYLINLTLFNRLPLHEDINDIIGDFTTLELFTFKKGNNAENFYDLCKSIHSDLWKDLEHKLFTGMDVQRELKKYNGLNITEILAPIVFTSLLNIGTDNIHDNVFIHESFQGINYSITQTSQVWLDNKIYEKDEELVMEWDYVEQLFDREVIGNMYNAYCYLIEYYSEHDWATKIPELLSGKDLTLIKDVNNTYRYDMLPSLSIPKAFEKSASVFPKRNAVTSSTGNKTYDELLDYSYKIANFILKKEKGIHKKNALIAVYLEKGWEQVASCLGIMMTGSAYLPLNIHWPEKRINNIFELGRVQYIITSKSLSNKLNNFKDNYSIICVDGYDILDSSSKTPNIEINLNHTAYVIFTSGSTGDPKGVSISHYGVMNTINDINKRFNITYKDKIFALSQLSFDLSVYDVFGVLVAGGTIVMPAENDYKSPDVWIKLICKNNITIWNTVPMLMNMFTEYLTSLSKKEVLLKNLKETLRLTFLSGDWIPLSLPNHIKNFFNKTKTISLGGATECSIWSIIYIIDKVDSSWKSIPYGKAMYNQKIYILNDSLEFCPVDVMGEIYIGGIGLALNYWNDSKKTRHSFTSHPKTGERLYKTGDIGILRTNGNIEFIGRKDRQIKIGGHRIEIVEVEKALKKTKLIKDCIVDIFGDKWKKHLTAYIVPSNFNSHKLEFKMQRLNIQTDHLTDIEYRLPTTEITKKELYSYFARKSYRKFSSESLKIESLEKILNKIIFINSQSEYSSNLLNSIEFIDDILKPLKSYKNETLMMHKYMYPSAGGLYPVRAYVAINKGIKGIFQGVYYYNPDNHCLIKVDDSIPVNINCSGVVSIYFYGYMPAIKPEYENMSDAFCYLEAGYMVALIMKSIKQLDYNIKFLSKKEENFNQNYLPIIELKIEGENVNSCSFLQNYNKINIPIYIIDKTVCEWILYKLEYRHLVKQTSWIPKNKLLFQEGKNQSIIEDAAFLIFFGNDNNKETLVEAGIITQQFTEEISKLRIGSCCIGYVELDETLKHYIPLKYTNTALAVGKIKEIDVVTRDVSRSRSEMEWDNNIEVVLKGMLSKSLPEYMIPKKIIVLNKMPLTMNGKLDRRKLYNIESSKLIGASSYIQPSTKCEKELYDIWVQILGVDKIGINDDFFELGGDSFSLMKLLTEIKKKYFVSKTVTWGFKNNTIFLQSKELINKLSYDKKLNPVFTFNVTKPISKVLIFIHPGGAGVEEYFEFAKKLNKKITFYGIESYNLCSDNSVITSIPDVVDKYIEYLIEIASLKNLYLGGWSFGGVIAYEMSRKLTKLNLKPKNIYLIDPPFIPEQKFIHINTQIKYINQRSIKHRFEDELILEEYIKKRNYVLKIENKMLTEYTLEKYEGRTVIFNATNSLNMYNRQYNSDITKYNHLKKIIKNLNIENISSDHFSIMDNNNLKKITDYINKDIYK
jgi:amino acid adenylation domain-containing protein